MDLGRKSGIGSRIWDDIENRGTLRGDQKMMELLRAEFDTIGVTSLEGHIVKIVGDKGGKGGSNLRVKTEISSNSRETATDASSK